MTIETIANKADFQRHLNGCEQHLNNLIKIFQTIEKQNRNFNQLNDISTQIKSLYSSILILEQSSFAIHGKKTQIKFDSNSENINNQQQEQLLKLIHNEEFELDIINQNKIHIQHLENDLQGIHETFFDINRLIHEQGTIVNNIEQELTNTDELIHDATENVQTTIKIKKRSRRIKWILISFFIGAFFILIIILYFTLKLALPIG